MRSKIDFVDETQIEWIPCEQFFNIKGIGQKGRDAIYSAIWEDGPLDYSQGRWKRQSNCRVCLKHLYDSQDISNERLNNEVNLERGVIGISQDPFTNNHILVLQNIYCEECGKQYDSIPDEWCMPCLINFLKKISISSGNEEIDNFIQELQLKINSCIDVIFEWIPYYQFNEIERLGENEYEYTAIWRDGPWDYDGDKNQYIRDQNKEVVLKYLNDSQDTKKFLDKVKEYLQNDLYENEIYGISQNPDTNDYIMVHCQYLDIYCEKCGKEYINKIGAKNEWCKMCQTNILENNFPNWTSSN
ncbi:hypothetical protein C1645_781718, partial [Glomus cerebriforme]